MLDKQLHQGTQDVLRAFADRLSDEKTKTFPAILITINRQEFFEQIPYSKERKFLTVAGILPKILPPGLIAPEGLFPITK